ncbi:MAG: NADH-quinone oxidoreductase subunit D [Holophagaceae bacterium]|nr:NADH-quinone oxidoreductase subunit D [Holophagaceae bacterium]
MFKSQEMEINMGPQHPSTHGVLRLKLRLDGETVKHCYPVIGYLHRGVEKICENKAFFQGQVWTDRMDYCSAISNNLGWAEAIEKLFGITVPRRARYLRTMLNELNRLNSHLLWLATHAMDIGALTVFLYCFRDREKVLDVFEAFCGSRLTTSAMRIGGLLEDIPEGFEKMVKDTLTDIREGMLEYETLLSENRIWLKRTVGIARLSADDCLAYGVTGPLLRAAGVAYDIRKAHPYAAYDEMKFEVPTKTEADTYARYLVRLEEMRQSISIVEQCLGGLPEGPIMAKLPKTLKSEVGEVYHPTEAPKGEIGYYLVSEKGGVNPYRFHIRTPGFLNLQAIPLMVQDALVADVIAAIGTLDVVLGEIDR